MNLIDSAIAEFYNRTSEDSRLQLGLGPLEFERNKELIGRYLGLSKMTIADIGGGTGHYAKWLSELGHGVTLLDPVEKHIKQAQQRSRKLKYAFKCILGEARALPFDDNSFDLVILHGPLYHLQEQDDRLKALIEAGRVLKPGGIILGFAITHAASTVAALQSGMIHQDGIFEMCKKELENGEHHPPEGLLGILPEAHFYRPSLLRSELKAAGLESLDLLAVEGMAWLDCKFFESWASPTKRQRLMELIKLTESDEELLCFSPHIMVVAGIDHF